MPMLCQLPYGPGSRVRVRSVPTGYPLPRGLPENADCLVIGFVPGTVEVEHAGLRFAVPMACIDSGFRVVNLPPPRPPSRAGPPPP